MRPLGGGRDDAGRLFSDGVQKGSKKVQKVQSDSRSSDASG